MQWHMVRLIAKSVALDYETADAAIAYAVRQGWLLTEGNPPHSIYLTDDGRICRPRC
jgi:hypothetical protein